MHITTCILPVIYKEFSSGYISGALNNMDVTFAINPVINAIFKIGMPLPAIDSVHQWKWVYLHDMDWRETTSFDNTSPAANFQPNPVEVSEGWLKLVKKEQE